MDNKINYIIFIPEGFIWTYVVNNEKYSKFDDEIKELCKLYAKEIYFKCLQYIECQQPFLIDIENKNIIEIKQYIDYNELRKDLNQEALQNAIEELQETSKTNKSILEKTQNNINKTNSYLNNYITTKFLQKRKIFGS
jgi:hypothetical protein